MENGTISDNSADSGGGVNVRETSTFYIVTGTVYGSDAEESLKNTATYGAALFVNNNGTAIAQYGTFNGTTWSSNGSLSKINNTITVLNGVLQQPYAGVPKTIKITGITLTDADTNGEGGIFIYTKPQFGHGPEAGLIAREVYHTGHIANGELLVDLYVCDDGYDASNLRWTGSGEYYIYIGFAGPIGWPDDVSGGTVLRYWWAKDGAVAKYDIKDALTTLEFSQFRKQ